MFVDAVVVNIFRYFLHWVKNFYDTLLDDYGNRSWMILVADALVLLKRIFNRVLKSFTIELFR